MTIDMQQIMPFPKLTTSKGFYLRQMSFYNFEIHIISNSIEKAVLFLGRRPCEQRKFRKLQLPNVTCQSTHVSVLYLKGIFYLPRPEIFRGWPYILRFRPRFWKDRKVSKNDTVYVLEKYREIITKASRKKQVIDIAQHFRKIADLCHKL